MMNVPKSLTGYTPYFIPLTTPTTVALSRVTSTLDSGSTVTGAETIAGGLGVAKSIYSNSLTTNSTVNVTNGNLTVQGNPQGLTGIANVGNVYYTIGNSLPTITGNNYTWTTADLSQPYVTRTPTANSAETLPSYATMAAFSAVPLEFEILIRNNTSFNLTFSTGNTNIYGNGTAATTTFVMGAGYFRLRFIILDNAGTYDVFYQI